MGAETARSPGAIISWMADFVEIATHRAESGSAVPSINPGMLRNCRRTSSIILLADRPTAFMVRAEKMNGNMPPRSSPTRTFGLPKSKSSCLTAKASTPPSSGDRLPGGRPESTEQGERRERRRANRKAFAHRRRRVAHRVERIGATAYERLAVAHLGDAARIVRHRSVRVDPKADPEGGQHPNGRNGDAVELRKLVTHEDRQRDHENRPATRHHAGPQTRDDVGRGAGFRLRRDVTSRREIFRRVVFGELPDGHTGREPYQDAPQHGERELQA